MILIIIVAATMFCCGSLGMIVYCCCCIEPAEPPSKKKKGKKKGEEEAPSPYTVHSYRGYVDSDDEDAFAVGPNGEVMKKDSSKASKKGSFKVYGPGGFEGEADVCSDDQDMGAVRKKIDTALPDIDSASATSDSESSMDEFATVPKSIHSVRSSLTAGSSYYSNASSTSYVEQAKAKHRQIKDYTVGSASIVSSDGASMVSFVEQGKAKLQLYKRDSGDSTSAYSTERSDDASKVSLMEQAMANLDLTMKDDDESVTADKTEIDNSTPVAENLDLPKKQSDASISESDAVSTSSLSFVEQARARLKSYQRSAGVSSSKSTAEESTYEESTSKSDHTFVSETKAKYTEARRASNSLESDREALVTKAKARYQALRTVNSIQGSSKPVKESSDESDVSVPE